MKILFDHNLPHNLRTSLVQQGGHQMLTAAYMGWGELKNGDLLRAAEDGGIEVLVTGDRSLIHEQNLKGRRLAIIVLSTNNWLIMKNHLAQILLAIESALPGSLQSIDCGRFTRKRR